MKIAISKILIVVVAIAMTACYGIEDENFKKLADITITSGEEIQVKQGQVAIVNIDVKSDLEVKYEWAYGTLKDKFPSMNDTTFISHSKTLDYAFPKPGSYVLRLRVDNGESIVFKYFHLQVQTGLDAGILVLCENDQHKGSLAFIKERNASEIENNEQEIWPDLMETVNPDFPFTYPSDMFLTNYVKQKSKGFLLGCADEKGTIFRIEPQTMEVVQVHKLADEYPGVKSLKFVGEGQISKSDYYCLMTATDKRIYRYDFFAYLPALRTTSLGELLVDRAYEGYDGEERIPFLFSDTQIAYIASTPKKYDLPEGYEILNMAYIRTKPAGVRYPRLNVIMRSTTNPRAIKMVNTSNSGSSADGAEYTASEDVPMDKNSIMVTTGADVYCYYNYNNKIYRWEVGNLSTSIFSLPKASEYQRLADGSSFVPEGEQICSISNNLSPYDDTIHDTYLIIATYNPGRAGDKKGSVYVIDLTNNTLVKKYEGICDKPVKVTYKFLI